MDVEGLILDVTPADGEFDRDFLEKLGHPVLVCHGPEQGHLCPILKGGCRLVDEAHGVIFQVDLDRPQHRAILKRCRQVLAEDVPIVAVVRHGQKERFKELLGGVQTWEAEPTVSELDGFAAEVEAADWTR
jgi:hypothetical protein